MTTYSNRKVFRPANESFKKKIFTVLEVCRNEANTSDDIYEKIRMYHPDMDSDLIDEILYWHG